MHLAGASFNSLPPIDLPFRYFISAMVFPIVLAVFILLSGEAPWSSRWHPAMLSITHGFTLGFIGSVMMGALLQMLPVIGGVSFPKVRLVASFSHLLYLLGTICLMLAFVVPIEIFQLSALVFLVISFTIYIGAVLIALHKSKSNNVTISTIRLAILLLIATVSLGLLMQLRPLGVNLIGTEKNYTNLHAFWGLFGWVSLLIIAVSFQVVPMFHLAPNFPTWLTKYLPRALTLTLILLVFLVTPITAQLSYWLVGSVLFLLSIYALSLLLVISRRKRKIPDTSIRYWQLAALSLLMVTALYFLPQQYLMNILPDDMLQKQELLFAALFIYFFIVSILQGMLLKIMPFLSYTHLQQSCLMNFSAMQFLPNMHELLSKKSARLLFVFHCFTGFSLLLTIIYPMFYWLLAGLIFIEFSFLLLISLKVVRLYHVCARKIISLPVISPS